MVGLIPGGKGFGNGAKGLIKGGKEIVGAVAPIARKTAILGTAGDAANKLRKGAPNSAVTRTNASLVDEIGTRSRAWAQRKQLTGSAGELGTRQHKYARDVLDRYQQMFGDRGLVTERSFINGLEVPCGSKGSTRHDVLDTITGDVWDYKFGVTPMSLGQINRIFQHGPGINSVIPLYK